MKAKIKKNFSIALFITITIATITFTCFAIGRRTGEVNYDASDVVSAAYFPPELISPNPELR